MTKLLERYLALREKARTDIFFLAAILKYNILVRYRDKPFYRGGLEALDKYRFSLIEIGRGWFKTTLFTKTRTIFKLLNDPDRRILIVSYTGSNACDMLRTIGNHFLENEDLRFLFPDICPININRPETGQWNLDGIIINRKSNWTECSVESLGADQNMVSKHFDDIICDDLVVWQNSRTKEQIEKTKEFIHKLPSLLNIFKDDCTLNHIGTDWAPDDTNVQIKEGSILDPLGEKYNIYVFPAEVNGDKGREATFPELFPLAKLDGLRKSDPTTYDSFYLLKAISLEGCVWTKDNIVKYDTLPKDLHLVCYGGVDPAISTIDMKRGSDTAAGVLGIDENNHVWTVDYRVSKGIDRLIDKDMFELYEQWKLHKQVSFRFFSIETKAFQKIILRLLRVEMEKRGIWIPVKEFIPIADKASRIMIFDGLIKNKAFHIRSDMIELETQILRFNPENLGSVKLDILDMFAQAYSQSQIGFKKKKEEDNDYKEDLDYSQLLGAMN